MTKIQPGSYGFPIKLKKRYDNFIGGKWVPPVQGDYFENITPVTGKAICEIANSTTDDIDLALDAAHKAKDAWGSMSVGDRARILNRIADRMEEHLELIATVETWDNGKPIRETFGADIPLAIDHFRYFAGCIRAQEGSLGEIDKNTVSYQFHEPLGVVGQIIPWNFPVLMATWKIAPALAAGNCIVLKPARFTPLSILIVAELIADILPAGVLNIVNGPGGEIGDYLSKSPRIAKIAFTGSTEVGVGIMRNAATHVTPITLELGGKSPNIFFADVMEKDDAFFDKTLEGFSMFAFNQGEVCTCPSRALIQESIYDKFIEKAIKRVKAMKQGNPLDKDTQVGAQVSQQQVDTINKYIKIGNEEGAKLLIGGKQAKLAGDLAGGFYIEPTVFAGTNDMCIFQDEIFGPVLSVAKFKDMEDALRQANDTIYGLGSGVWTRNINTAYRMGRGIQAGRVWTNCFHAYPAHSAFGGYKRSGFGRETHKMILNSYQQTKNLLVSYDENAQGFF